MNFSKKNKITDELAYLVANQDRLIKTPEDRKALKKLKKKHSKHLRKQ